MRTKGTVEPGQLILCKLEKVEEAEEPEDAEEPCEPEVNENLKRTSGTWRTRKAVGAIAKCIESMAKC